MDSKYHKVILGDKPIEDVVDEIWQPQQERHTVGEIQRRIPGQITRHEDVNLMQGRVGEAERKHTVQHLKDMHKAGYIDEDEALIRQAHAAEAKTQDDLNGLTADIPGPVDHRNYFQAWNWNQSKYHMPVLIGGIAASILLPIITGFTLQMVDMFNSHAGQAVFYPILALGIMGFFLSLVLLVIKTSE